MQIAYHAGALYRQLNLDLDSKTMVLSITAGQKMIQSWLQGSDALIRFGINYLKIVLACQTIWTLLEKAERRKTFVLIVYLVIGTILELISVGALVPLIQVLTQSNLQSKYPLVDRMFGNSSDQFIVTVILVVVTCIF